MSDGTNLILTLFFSLMVTIATIVIAWATLKYVKLNAALVEETRLLRKAQTDPRISVYMRPQDSGNTLVDLVLRNDSQAPAFDLNFQIDPDLYYFPKRKFSDIYFLQHLSSLQPGESRNLPMYTGYWKSLDGSKDSMPQSTIITITYQDIMGNKKEDKFPIPLASFARGEEWTHAEPALDRIATSLREFERMGQRYLKHIETVKD
jgi:hypothetical protein